MLKFEEIISISRLKEDHGCETSGSWNREPIHMRCLGGGHYPSGDEPYRVQISYRGDE